MDKKWRIYAFNDLTDVFTFGAFINYPLSDVIDVCPEYIEWCVYNIPTFILEDEVIEEIHLIYPQKYCSAKFEAERLHNIAFVNNLYQNEDEYDSEDFYDTEKSTFNRYRGSWAQDEMGYSDDEIDTVFDGDSDAYWNID